jgi:hypothetical protein
MISWLKNNCCVYNIKDSSLAYEQILGRNWAEFIPARLQTDTHEPSEPSLQDFS